ncbi:hypothetical protein FACS1894190_06950 [Spirochaetia bacterium]|nr:hypothetical protein FACS1894190_06950 [Spirochaetia bacterium]
MTNTLNSKKIGGLHGGMPKGLTLKVEFLGVPLKEFSGGAARTQNLESCRAEQFRQWIA